MFHCFADHLLSFSYYRCSYRVAIVVFCNVSIVVSDETLHKDRISSQSRPSSTGELKNLCACLPPYILLSWFCCVTSEAIQPFANTSSQCLLYVQLDDAGEKIVWSGLEGVKEKDRGGGKDDGKSISLASITAVEEGV